MHDIYPDDHKPELTCCQALEKGLEELTQAYQSALDSNTLSEDSFSALQTLVEELRTANTMYDQAFTPETIHYAYTLTTRALSDYDFDALSRQDIQEIQSFLYTATSASNDVKRVFSVPKYNLEDQLDADDVYFELEESLDAITLAIDALEKNTDPLNTYIKECNLDLSNEANVAYLQSYLKKHQEDFIDAVAKMVAIESAYTYETQALRSRECQTYIEKMPNFLQGIGVKTSTLESKLVDEAYLAIRILPIFTLTLEAKVFGVGGRFTNDPRTRDLEIKLAANIGNATHIYSHEYLHFLSNYGQLPLDTLMRSHWDWSVIGVSNQQVGGIDLYKGANPQAVFEAPKFNPQASQHLQQANEAITECLTVMYQLYQSGQLELNESSLEESIKHHADQILQQPMSDYGPLVNNLLAYVNSPNAQVTIEEVVAAYFDKAALIELFRKDQGAAMSDFLMSFQGIKGLL